VQTLIRTRPSQALSATCKTYRAAILVVVATCLSGVFASAQEPIKIDASSSAFAPMPVRAELGTNTRPDGQTIGVNSQYLLLNHKAWLPVMGEFHYTRVPREDWETEILKMKAGGVQIISTYVIWIHHEEIEGQFDWSGRRDLRAFVALCAKHGMYVYPRLGPWAHGEARNGGLPDWVLAEGATRKNDPVYLSEVTKLFEQIGQQLKGQLWKDGGPVIGIQFENEYRGDGSPGTGDDHIRTLKKIAVQAGMDVPLYTVTGWDGAAIPLDAVFPVYGGYPDAPWDGSPKKLPPNEVYVFRTKNRVGGNMGIIGGGGQNPSSVYAGTPFLTAEVGSGMQDTYFRRPVVSADDIASIPSVILGSGANLLGFYMFQGGRNPDGKVTTLQESQATGYPTDVPVKSYDFQAPLGEYGGERPSFRRLKLVNYFLNDFGSALAPMSPHFPAELPTNPADLSVPRVSARNSGNHAFVFFNNYIRGTAMPERKHFSITLQLASQIVAIPSKPIDLSSGAYGIWPVNLDLGGYTLRYSTAQLFHRFTRDGETYFCFFTIPGVDSEFALQTSEEPASLTEGLKRRVESGITFLTQTGSSPLQEAVFSSGQKKVHLLLFSREEAENTWKIPGQAVPLITSADFFADKNVATLRSNGRSTIGFSLLKGEAKPSASAPIHVSSETSVLSSYFAEFPEVKLPSRLNQTSPGSPREALAYGKSFSWRKQPLPLAPDDQAFAHAGRWIFNLPDVSSPGLNDVSIVIRYNGDVARLVSGKRLIDDDFWNGQPWRLSLNDLRFEGVHKDAELQVLNWPLEIPMYLEPPAVRDSTMAPSLNFVPVFQLKLDFASQD
jgi:beta-galactosidase